MGEKKEETVAFRKDKRCKCDGYVKGAGHPDGYFHYHSEMCEFCAEENRKYFQEQTTKIYNQRCNKE